MYYVRNAIHLDMKISENNPSFVRLAKKTGFDRVQFLVHRNSALNFGMHA